jgi:fused signal recognition particle receptor
MLKFWKKKPPEPAAGTPQPDAGTSGEDSEAARRQQANDGANVEALERDRQRESGNALAASPQPAALEGEAQSDLATPGAAAGSPLTSVAASPATAVVGDVVDASPADRDDGVAAAPAPKKSWRERLAGSFLNRDIRELLGSNPILDDALLDELETILIGADVGVAASTELVESLRARVAKRKFANAAALLDALRADLVALLTPVAQPLRIESAQKPFVILMVGVNGVGKTTTIGKLARRLLAQRRSVVLAAGDTFRAAAVEQLRTWGERNNVPVVAQGSGSDAASVIFDALQSASSKQVDVLIADTAGRLHTQSGLMDELAKIRRVLAKLDASAPHEVLLVIDGTTGQNAISQTRQFLSAIGVTGLVVTKLDGTAKGGVVFALAKEFGLPIRFVGLGESAEDLREFDPAAFVDALLPPNIGGGS